MSEPRWQCELCMRERTEKFCACGGRLRAVEEPVFVPSRGTQDAQRRDYINELIREYGIAEASKIVGLDAVYAAMKPAKWSLR